MSALRFAEAFITACAPILLASERGISCVKLWIRIALLIGTAIALDFARALGGLYKLF